MPSNARVKQVLQFCNVKRQRRIQYKGNNGMLMIVRDSIWTNAVEKGLALSQVIEGTTDYAVETIEEVPDRVLDPVAEKFGKVIGKAMGYAYSGLSKDLSQAGKFKLLFVPDDEDREYLVFETSLTLKDARAIQDELEGKGSS